MCKCSTTRRKEKRKKKKITVFISSAPDHTRWHLWAIRLPSNDSAGSSAYSLTSSCYCMGLLARLGFHSIRPKQTHAAALLLLYYSTALHSLTQTDKYYRTKQTVDITITTNITLYFHKSRQINKSQNRALDENPLCWRQRLYKWLYLQSFFFLFHSFIYFLFSFYFQQWIFHHLKTQLV